MLGGYNGQLEERRNGIFGSLEMQGVTLHVCVCACMGACELCVCICTHAFGRENTVLLWRNSVTQRCVISQVLSLLLLGNMSKKQTELRNADFFHFLYFCSEPR
jgi:hypothetical protein